MVDGLRGRFSSDCLQIGRSNLLVVIGVIALITLFSIESKLRQGNKQDEKCFGLLNEIKEQK